MDLEKIAKSIDYAVLKPTATDKDVVDACDLTAKYKFASLCLKPRDLWIPFQMASKTPVCTVIDFPHGHLSTKARKQVLDYVILDELSNEIDIVMQLGKFASGHYTEVLRDLTTLVEICHYYSSICKIIIEGCYWDDVKLAIATKLVLDSGADFIKTSTGFGPSGATPEMVQIMLNIADGKMGVKASGGIKTREQAEMYLSIGCTRLGVSSIKGILE